MINKNRGFSLAQVLISIGILTFSIAAIMTMVQNTVKFQKGIELTDDLQNSIAIVRMALGVPSVCGANIPYFQNPAQANLPKFDSSALASQNIVVTELRSNPTKTILTNNLELPGKPGSNVTMNLTGLVEIVANSSYIGELQFFLDKDADGSHRVAGNRKILRTLPVSLTTTNVGTIQTIIGCSVKAINLTSAELNVIKQDMCASLNGTWDGSTGKCDIGPFYQP
jgi:hypothetical protein